MKWILLLLFFPVSLAAAQDLNVGFVQGLWYSKTPFFAGDTIRIYTAIQNNSGFDLQGTIEFFANGKSIGESSFSAVNSRIVEAWTDWQVTQGNHSLGARVKQAFLLEVGKNPEPISFTIPQLGEAQVFADLDSDKDGIGDAQDADDDNDLLSDETEKELGTNPLIPDTDQDGLSDHEEVSLGTNPLNQDTDQDGIPDAIEIAQNTNPLSSPVPKEPVTEEVGDSLVNTANQKIDEVVNKVLPEVVKTVDSFVEETVEKLKQRKQQLAQKEKPKSTGEQGLNLLLAAAITALPQWQLGLVLFFAIGTALLLRRLTKEPSTGG